MDRRDFLKTSAFGAALFGLSGVSGCRVKVKNDFDTIIKNGVIYVGDGKAPIKGDLAIRDGKIAAIGETSGRTLRPSSMPKGWPSPQVS